MFICFCSGVLTRCLVSLEQKDVDGSRSTEASDALREVWLNDVHFEHLEHSCKKGIRPVINLLCWYAADGDLTGALHVLVSSCATLGHLLLQ